MEEGILIAFEGIDGSGLSTQASRARDELEKRAYLFSDVESEPVTYLTKEPTDGPVGGEIREVLTERLEIDPETLALMFAADRRDHTEQSIRPMIDEGKIVLVDRYYLSSLAYQGVEVGDLDWIKSINSKAMMPDLTILFDVSVSVASERIENNRLTKEVFENPEKQKQVRQKYIEVADSLSEEGLDIRVVNGEKSPDRVEREVMKHIHEKIGDYTQSPLDQNQ